MTDLATIYLDHAATTPLDGAVLAAMQPYLTEWFYNPSAQYDAARKVKQDLEDARAAIAHWVGARPNELTFTAGGTEANNLAINGVMSQYPGANVVVSSIEHDSILRSAEQYPSRLVAVQPDGRIDLKSLKASIDDHTVLVSVQYVNNELGTVQPLKDVARVVQDVRSKRRANGIDLPIYMHTDACQASGYLDIHASRLGADMITINASKIYGPKQIGALFVKAGIVLQAQILGGGQERGKRSGTENVAGSIGFATALTMAQEGRHKESERLRNIQQEFMTQLEQKIPTIVINGSKKYRTPNNVHVTIPGQDNERLMMQLDNEGIIVAVGSACSASNDEPSHVLTAIGLTDAEAQASLRFTMGRSTTTEAITRVVDVLAKLVG